MKYNPEPIEEWVYDEYLGQKVKETHWTVDFDDEGYIFDSQDNAMMFCLLLEIRDLLKDDINE